MTTKIIVSALGPSVFKSGRLTVGVGLSTAIRTALALVIGRVVLRATRRMELLLALALYTTIKVSSNSIDLFRS